MEHKRQRLDSVLHGLLDGERDMKKLGTEDSRWKKIDHIINKPTTSLILFEVPKGVSVNKNSLMNIV